MATQKRKSSPRGDFTTRADTQHAIASCAVVTNLLRVDGKPRFAPQRSVFVSVAGGTVTLTPEKGIDFTLTIPANFPVVHEAAVKATVSATGTVAGHFYWWDGAGQLDWNNEA